MTTLYETELKQAKDGTFYRWVGEDEKGTKQNFRLGRDKPEAKRRLRLILALYETQAHAAEFYGGSWVAEFLTAAKKIAKGKQAVLPRLSLRVNDTDSVQESAETYAKTLAYLNMDGEVFQPERSDDLTDALRAVEADQRRKRVYRLWRREGLKVPQIRRKRRRPGTSGNSCIRRRAKRPNDVWPWDFVFDRTSNGHQLKWLSIVDEFTRECLCLSVGRRFTSLDVIDEKVLLSGFRGLLQHIRSDNGPEFIAAEIGEWLKRPGVETLDVEPGSPWENAYAESFHSRLRDEFLSMEEFDSLSAARRLTAMWTDEYNHLRPHSSLGYRAPAGFAADWTASIAVAALPPFQQSNSIPVTQP